ncbi:MULTISPECIES: RNA polymerase sigma factor region1.1 domain-containing protein [Pseudomonadaceae]|uniref:RNA polymerase sigma factor 70 region 1.1 domain-containing protein n=1 Tax=Aquipseudomonas guryensis TaxID=2759165 RepID=A0A7W4H3R1_9GAMM|nr:hypothetical protein [Pseudomonas guryensis]
MHPDLKSLISKGRSQGFLLKSEVLEILPEDITQEELINDILLMISDMGISIVNDQASANNGHPEA